MSASDHIALKCATCHGPLTITTKNAILPCSTCLAKARRDTLMAIHRLVAAHLRTLQAADLKASGQDVPF